MSAGGSTKTTGLDAARANEAREQILAIVEQLPEARALAQGPHLSLEVRERRFGWFLVDHHGNGRVAVHCRALPAGRAQLAEEMPDVVHVPEYLGRHGWIGLWLDSSQVKWRAVRIALTDAYRMTAPKTLVARLGS